MADNVCQFFGSPLCCRVLCSEITVRVQVQNDNAVAGEVVVCQQFLIQEQMAVRHVNVIFRHMSQFLFHVADGVVSEIADQTGEVGSTLQHRRAICCHAFFQKGNGLFHFFRFDLVTSADLCGITGNADLLFRRNAHKRIPVPLHTVADAFQNKRIPAVFRKSRVDVQRGLIVGRKLIEHGNGVILFCQCLDFLQ